MSNRFVLGFSLRICVLVFVLNTTVECNGKDEVASRLEPDRVTARSQIEPFVNWFPADTESLVVLREDYCIPAKRPTDNDAKFSISIREKLIDFLLDRPSTRQILSGRTIKLWIEGGRHFRLPGLSHIEGVIFDGCHVMVFTENVGNASKRLMDRLKLTGGTRHDFNGLSVVEYVPRYLKLQPHGFSYWIMSPQPDVLLIATHPEFLREMLVKVMKPDNTAFPHTLAEWKYVNPDAAIWGIRRYPKNFGKLDLSDVRLPEDGVTGNTSGFAFSIDEGADRARIVWFSCDATIVQRLNKSFQTRVSDDESGCTFQSSTDGTVTISIEWPNEAKNADASSRRRIRAKMSGWLQWYLGYAAVF